MKIVKKKNYKKFPCNKNILISTSLNIFNILILIFLRIFYDKIFFLKIDKYLRNKKILLVLEFFEINWLNYNLIMAIVSQNSIICFFNSCIFSFWKGRL